MAVIFFPLTTEDVEQLSICLPISCVSSLGKGLFKSFAIFLVGLFVFLLLS